MRKIFLDVGGHIGQTLEEVTKPNYRFDKIFCFEPMPKEFSELHANFGMVGNLSLQNYGLADSTGDRLVYGTNQDMGASIYQTKVDLDDPAASTRCRFLRATEFFQREINKGDLVVMKLNCEGSEAIILNDLVDSGEIEKIANVMVDFDVRKIPDCAGEEQQVLEKFKQIGFDRFCLAERVMYGPTHQLRIRNWLFGLSFHETIANLI